jgi:FkbM family methyltransferase
MTALREALAKAAFVQARPLLQRVQTRLPWFYRSLAALGRIVFPWEERVWIRCERGLAAGLYLKLNPRFETQAIYGTAGTIEQAWRDLLVPGTVFYDIGSHIGYFAVAAARRIGDSGEAYAFEPDPANVRLIAENAARNSVVVEVIEKAAWKRSGERLRFVRASSASDPSRMGGRLAPGGPAAAVRLSLTALSESRRAEGPVTGRLADGLQPAGKLGKETIEVETVALDEFVRSHRPPTFIKIDVEGAEVEVLEGARALLERFHPALSIEIHGEAIRGRVAEILAPLGYHMRPMPPEERLWLALPDARRG